jgi:hypothetical protein
LKNFIDWSATTWWVVAHIRAVTATVGITGFGVAFVKFLRHAPAPRKDSLWAGCLFDTFQDLASNDSRIGERRDACNAQEEPAAPPLPEQQI